MVDGVNGSICRAAAEAMADAINRYAADRRRCGAWRRGLRPGALVTWDGVDREAVAYGVTKLIIQIPCLNEAETLPATLADLPRSMPGIDIIEVLVIDDGSRDGTAEVARAHGVDHVVRFRRRKGLAAAFTPGIDAALKLGADFIVNTDADNQYVGADIASWSSRCCAARPTSSSAIATSQALSAHVVAQKKRLQRLGSWVVRQVSGTERAGHDQRLPRLHARSRAAHDDRLGVLVHARVDHPGRQEADGDRARADSHESATRGRRACSTACSGYIKRSAATIVRIYAMYEPLKVFTYIGADDLRAGLALRCGSSTTTSRAPGADTCSR